MLTFVVVLFARRSLKSDPAASRLPAAAQCGRLRVRPSRRPDPASVDGRRDTLHAAGAALAEQQAGEAVALDGMHPAIPTHKVSNAVFLVAS